MKVFSQKARASKATRICRKCQHEIVPGEIYRATYPRFGPPKIWCKDHHPRPSDLAGGKLSEAYALQEDLQDDLAAFQGGSLGADDLKSSCETAVSEAESLAEQYEESIANMPDSLQQSPVAEECQERADALREWAEELNGVDIEDEPTAEDVEVDAEIPEEEREEALEEALEEKRAEWREAAASVVEEALESLQI